MSRAILTALSVSVALLLLVTAGAQRFWRDTQPPDPVTTAPMTAAVAQAQQIDSPLSAPGMTVATQQSAPTIQLRQPLTVPLLTNRPTLYLVFDQPMDHTTVSEALTVTPTVDLRTSWTNDTLYISPIDSFTPTTVYTFTIDTRATNTGGAHLLQPYSWHHRTPARLDHWRVADATRLDSQVVLRFSDPVSTTAMTLAPSSPITWAWNQLHTELTVTPERPLYPYSTYQLVFADGIRDNKGQAVEIPQRLDFSTPAPLRVDPVDRYVSPAVPLTIPFTPPIDPIATAATLQLTPPISGTTAWVEDTLIFTPTRGYFAPNTLYQVQVTPITLGNTATISSSKPISWTFQTTGLTAWANLGTGIKFQAIDSARSRTIQYQRNSMNGTDAPPLDFALYALDPEAVVPLLYALPTGQNWADPNVPYAHVDTLELSEVARWQVSMPEQLFGEMGNMMGPTVYTTTIPAAVPPGAYLLNLETGYVNDQLLVLLTPQLIMVKQADEQLMVWVTSSDGHAAAAVPVEIYDDAGTQIDRGQTDEAGRFTLHNRAMNSAQLVIAHTTDGISAVGISSAWRNDGSPWADWQPFTPSNRYTTYLYTDRPIYRPGQTVHFKAIVRSDADALLTTPPVDTPVTMRVRDARDNIVQSYALLTNEFGTVNEEFILAEGAMLGTYALEIEVDAKTAGDAVGELSTNRVRHPFMVEEYHKPDYQVTMTVTPTNPVLGEFFTVTVESDYFMGLPVVDGEVVLRQYRLDDDPYMAPLVPVAQWNSIHEDVTGQLDADGRWRTTLRLGGDNSTFYDSMNSNRWVIEATVHDAARQRAANFVIVESSTSTNADQPLTLELSSDTKAPGEPFLINVQTARVGAQRVDMKGAQPQQLRLNINQYNGDQPIPAIGVTGVDIRPNAEGIGRLYYLPERAGFYQFQLTDFGAKGYPGSTVETSVLIHDPALPWTEISDGYLGLEVAPGDYQPGDIAQLRLLSDFRGTALLALERGTVPPHPNCHPHPTHYLG